MKRTKLLRLLPALLAALFMLTACSGNTDEGQTDAADPGSDLTVTTPYCDLKYPEQWKEQVKTEYSDADDGGAVTFSTQIDGTDTKLFAVLFTDNMDTDGLPVGVLNGGEAPVMVSLKIYDIEPAPSWTDEDTETAYALQDECNYLLEHLQARADFDMNYESYFAPANPEIKMPFCTLSYPGMWGDRVWWEFKPVDDGGDLNIYGLVAADVVRLFSLGFGTDPEDSVPVGSLAVGDGQLSVSLVVPEPEDTDRWTVADWDNYSAMQECINDLMASLSENPDFVAN